MIKSDRTSRELARRRFRGPCGSRGEKGRFRERSKRQGLLAAVAVRKQRGGVLLEVVIALALFVAAAAIITSGMNAAVRSVERQRLNTHGVNLAATVMSELRMGLRVYDPADPEPLEAPYPNWTWQVVATPEESLDLGSESGFQQVEVIVRHQQPAHTVRLMELLPVNADDVTGLDAP